MSDFTILDENDKYFPRIVKKINEQYAVWVKDLILEYNNFNNEIEDLKNRIDKKEDTTKMIVFLRKFYHTSVEKPSREFSKI
jgi:hypothetical protein